MFESLSRTVTCARGLISIYMYYSRGKDFIPSCLDSTVVQLLLSGCPVVHLYLVFVRYQVPYVLDAHDECYINYV